MGGDESGIHDQNDCYDADRLFQCVSTYVILLDASFLTQQSQVGLDVSQTVSTIREFLSSPAGKRILRILRRVFTVGVISWIAYQFTEIGWSNLARSLPTEPWFYVIFLGMYFTAPVAEAVIYGRIWHLPFRRTMSATLRKRVYNKEIIGYSGELFIYFWGLSSLDMPANRVMHGVKDNTIVSSVVATIVAFGVLAILYVTGQIRMPAALLEHSIVFIVIAVVVAAAVGAAFYRFRKSILHLSGGLLLMIAGIHIVRQLTVQTLQVLEWSVVMPDIAISNWFTLLAVQIVLSRFPIPSSSFVFLGASTKIVQSLGLPGAPYLAMVATHTILDKILNLVFFSWLSFTDRSRGVFPDPSRAASGVEDHPVPDATTSS